MKERTVVAEETGWEEARERVRSTKGPQGGASAHLRRAATRSVRNTGLQVEVTGCEWGETEMKSGRISNGLEFFGIGVVLKSWEQVKLRFNVRTP